MSGTGGFQTQVYDQPAAAVAGDRASMNPLFSYDAGPGGLIAGSSLFTGRFAWVTPPLDPNGTPTIANSFGAGIVAGFLMNTKQALNTTYLSNAGQQVQQGYECALVIGGDFWVVNDGTTDAYPGQKAFADYATGKASFAAAGATPSTGASATGSSIAASTFSVTGSIANGDELTVSAVGSGTVVNGNIAGTGVNSGTKIIGQISGTTGGVGVYRINQAQADVASTTISGTYGTFTVGTLTTTGKFAPNQVLNATGSVVAGTQITQLLTGDGGTGSTLVVDNNTVVTSQVISAQGGIETKWYARSAALPGQIVKISSTPLG